MTRQRRNVSLFFMEGEERIMPSFPPTYRAVPAGRAATSVWDFLCVTFRFTGAYFSTVFKIHFSRVSRPHGTGPVTQGRME